MLDEIIAFERELRVAWVQRYVPARAPGQSQPSRPIDGATVDALHACAVARWDAHRHPDRLAARAEFETACALILLGAAQLFVDGAPLPSAEWPSGEVGTLPVPNSRPGRCG